MLRLRSEAQPLGSSAIPFAVSTLFALLFGSAVAAIVVIFIMRRGFAGVDAPSCGDCGYAVAGSTPASLATSRRRRPI